jgi:hypothetical protein
MSSAIVNLRLDGGDERAIHVAIALLEYALQEVAQVAQPRTSTRRKYKGSSLARGTLRVPLSEEAVAALEAQIRARLCGSAPAPATDEPAATGETRRL